MSWHHYWPLLLLLLIINDCVYLNQFAAIDCHIQIEENSLFHYGLHPCYHKYFTSNFSLYWKLKKHFEWHCFIYLIIFQLARTMVNSAAITTLATCINLWTDALDLVDSTRFSGLENACNFIQKSQLFIFWIDSCRVALNDLMVVTLSYWVLKLPQEECLKKQYILQVVCRKAKIAATYICKERILCSTQNWGSSDAILEREYTCLALSIIIQMIY